MAYLPPNRCGNCTHWMDHYTCPKEVYIHDKGVYRGPAMNDSAFNCAMYKPKFKEQQT